MRSSKLIMVTKVSQKVWSSMDVIVKCPIWFKSQIKSFCGVSKHTATSFKSSKMA